MFSKKISPSLAICFQQQSSFLPNKPKLAIQVLPSWSTKPLDRNLSFSSSTNISTLPELAKPEPAQPEPTQHRSRNKLKITNVKFSNFPEACPVCHLLQCEQDFRHTIYWTVFETLEESLAKTEEKPPDEEKSS